MANSIYKKIEQKGQEEANEIYQNGIEKAREMTDAAIKTASLEVEQIVNKNNAKYQDLLKTKITEFEQLAKQKSLARKKALIDDVFANVYDKLQNLNDNDLFDIIVKLIKHDNINGDEVIVVSKDDFDKYVRILSSGNKQGDLYVLDKLNQVLGPKYQLKLANEPGNIEGGFLIIGKSYDINHSFKTVLNQIKEQEEATIAKQLFGQEE